MSCVRTEYCTRGHLMSQSRKVHPNGDTYCSFCKNERMRKFRKNFLDRMAVYQRISNLRRHYGIKISEYDKILKRQNGKCVICEGEPGLRRLHVDHDHMTGKVRGLLCHSCNTAIGLLKENNKIIIKIGEYLGLSKKKRK